MSKLKKPPGVTPPQVEAAAPKVEIHRKKPAIGLASDSSSSSDESSKKSNKFGLNVPSGTSVTPPPAALITSNVSNPLGKSDTPEFGGSSKISGDVLL